MPRRPRLFRLDPRPAAAALLAIVLMGLSSAGHAAEPAPAEDPKQFVQFVEDFAGMCVARQGKEILVKNTHPTRTLRIWLDRYHMGTGTGDRSRSELRPGAEPEPLGCSRTSDGPQEWRLVRAVFVD